MAFNNRELAAIIWLAVLAGMFVRSRSVRSAFKGLFKSLLQPKTLLVFSGYLIYFFLSILLLYQLGLWEFGYVKIKETLYWFLGSGTIMLFNFQKVYTEERFFMRALLQHFKFSTILSAFLNLASFPLIIELALLPILFLASFAATLGQGQSRMYTDGEIDPANLTFVRNLGIITIILIMVAYTWHSLKYASHTTSTNLLLSSLLLPLLLTALILPYIFFLALYALYESMFARIDLLVGDALHSKLIKRSILFSCGLNLWKLTNLSENLHILVKNHDKEVAKLRHVINGLSTQPRNNR